MATRQKYSRKKQIAQDGGFKNSDSAFAYDPLKKVEIKNIEEWYKQISFYREHLDIYLEEVLGINIFDFQHVISRAIGNYDDLCIIESRSMGKSWLVAACLIALATLYSNLKIGVTSKTLKQANLIIRYVKDFASQYPNVSREIIHPIRIQKDGSEINFRSGSYIKTFSIAQEGDSARGERFGVIVLEESRLIPDKVKGEVIKPMMQWNRPLYYYMREKLGYKDFEDDFRPKIIEISSAYLKSSTLFDKFKFNLENMDENGTSHFSCALDYAPGVRVGVVKPDFVANEKKSLPTVTFLYEWGSVFCGVGEGSFFKFNEIEKCRLLNKVELQQPKHSKSRYIIIVDPAVSSEKWGDFTCIAVLKIKEKSDGTFWKELVYIRTYKGLEIQEICDELKRMYLNFPNTERIIVDINGVGRSIPGILDSSWVYEDKEYPALIDPEDEKRQNIPNALSIMKYIKADNEMNNDMANYMKVCFQDGSFRMPKSRNDYREDNSIDETDDDGEPIKKKKDKSTLIQEESILLDSEAAIYEILNIRKKETNSGRFIFEKIQSSMRKDRYSALCMGLIHVKELEEVNKQNLYNAGDMCIGAAFSF